MVDKTFLRITNRDIYTKIEEFIKNNAEEHSEIATHLITTNGKVKLNRWIATTALSLLFVMMGVMINSHWM